MPGSKKSRGSGLVTALVSAIGSGFILGGVAGWVTTREQLVAEKITVADDAERFSGARLTGPLTAFYQAETVKKHVLGMTGGRAFAELPMDDPHHETALQGATVRSSLMASTMAFGVSALAAVNGVALLAVAKKLSSSNK